MRHVFRLALAIFVTGAAAPASEAGSLQVSTVNLDVTAPAAATAMTLSNAGASPVNAQLRVFKWQQANGIEELTPTDDVVASPPFAVLEPGTKYTVRIVRTSQQAVATEEAYRLFIDEIPEASGSESNGVKLAMRYSIPVFFGQGAKSKSRLSWSASLIEGTLHLVATNFGDRRVRLSGLKLTDAQSRNAVVTKGGLVGYVLAQSEFQWSFPLKGANARTENVLLSVMSDGGLLNESLAITRLP